MNAFLNHLNLGLTWPALIVAGALLALPGTAGALYRRLRNRRRT